jgi:hypothetical protein
MRQDSRSTKIATVDRMRIAQAHVAIRSGQFWQTDEYYCWSDKPVCRVRDGPAVQGPPAQPSCSVGMAD